MIGSSVDRDFTKNFLISLGAHAALLLVAYASGKFLVDLFRSKDVEIIRAAVRVDVVGMPKYTVQELRALQKTADLPVEPEVAKGAEEKTEAPVEDVIKEGDLVIPEVDKKKEKSFLNMLSNYSSKKVAPKQKDKGKSEATGNKNLQALVIEGNRLSKGTALVGDYSDEANSEFAGYVQTLPDKIRAHWKLPSYLLDKNLRCRIRVFLSPSGKLLKLEIVESSGVPEFDARAEKAIRDSAPFPPPSQAVGARLADSGIILGFPL